MKNPFEMFEGLNGTNFPSRVSTSGGDRFSVRWPKYQGVVGAWYFRRPEIPSSQLESVSACTLFNSFGRGNNVGLPFSGYEPS